jgi:DNA-binding NarL/FixJ family response regulator
MVLGTVDANRGQFDRSAKLVAESDRVHGGIGSNYCLALLQAARTSAALAGGRPAEAFQHAERLFDSADPSHHPAVARWAMVVRDLVDAALASGNADAAAVLLAPFGRTGGTAEQRGTFGYADAVLSGSDFDERYRAALALAPPSVYFQARLQLAYGLRLRRERRVIDARALLRSAAAGFQAIDAAPWGERALQELRASGERVRHRTVERRDDLTPQELQIAELASQGLTNREIAARLFVSHRTVGAHLYRIFPKLGIATRGELAAALRESRDG